MNIGRKPIVRNLYIYRVNYLEVDPLSPFYIFLCLRAFFFILERLLPTTVLRPLTSNFLPSLRLATSHCIPELSYPPLVSTFGLPRILPKKCNVNKKNKKNKKNSTLRSIFIT